MSGNQTHEDSYISGGGGSEIKHGQILVSKTIGTKTDKRKHWSLYCFSRGVSTARKLWTKALWWGQMSTIIAPYHKKGEKGIRGYTCQDRWIQCSTHPLSVLCPCGYCRYYHCTSRQSVDACSHSLVVRAGGSESSSAISEYTPDECVHWSHSAVRAKKLSSKEKGQPNNTKDQMLSFVIT